jgi:flagellar hook assembly protein FlgD
VHLALPGYYYLRVYNSAGELVKTLRSVNPSGAPIDERVEWDGTNEKMQPVASGVYILHFVTRFDSSTAKLLIVR